MPSFPWPIKNNFVTVGCSRVCVGLLLARLCFNCVYLSFFQRLCLSFYSNMALVSMYCLVLWCEQEVELAEQSSSCRERLQPDSVGVSVWPSVKLRG